MFDAKRHPLRDLRGENKVSVYVYYASSEEAAVKFCETKNISRVFLLLLAPLLHRNGVIPMENLGSNFLRGRRACVCVSYLKEDTESWYLVKVAVALLRETKQSRQ